MSDDPFSGTGVIIFCMLVYGFIALCSSTLFFNWQFAVGSIIFIFLLEFVINLIIWWRNKK